MSPCCNPRPLAVLGASARSLVQSAARAGIEVRAADCFADADLREACARTIRIDDYPQGLLRTIGPFSGSAWCHVGGLENHPDLIERLSAIGPLAGSPASAVRKVRDPSWLAERSSSIGAPMPETRRSPEGVPRDGSFLMKPLGRAGGRGIVPWRGGDTPAHACIWQRRIVGLPCSAGFVADRAATTLLLTTRQLIGWPPSCGGSSPTESFAWTGGTTFDPGDAAVAVVESLGRHVAAEAGLVGLFGIDFLLGEDGRVVPIEVNPRPTASMELWDRATGSSHALAHMRACGLADAAPPTRVGARPDDPSRVRGKAVLFAREAVAVSPRMHAEWLRLRESWRDERGFPGVADIPLPGAAVPRGGPVVTVFAEGEEEDAVLEMLAGRLADAWTAALDGHRGP